MVIGSSISLKSSNLIVRIDATIDCPDEISKRWDFFRSVEFLWNFAMEIRILLLRFIKSIFHNPNKIFGKIHFLKKENKQRPQQVNMFASDLPRYLIHRLIGTKIRFSSPNYGL